MERRKFKDELARRSAEPLIATAWLVVAHLLEDRTDWPACRETCQKKSCPISPALLDELFRTTWIECVSMN